MTQVEQVRGFPPLLDPVQVDDDGTTIAGLGRPAFRVRVHGEIDIDVISVHLKSNLLSFPGGRFNPRDEDERARYAVYALHRRAAEAAGIRSDVTGLLDGMGQHRPVVVAGDLNDEAQAATTQILLGPPGSELGRPGYDQPDSGDGARLWNLAALISEPERYSRIYRGRRELIDHLLISHTLRDSVTAVTTGQTAVPSITSTPVPNATTLARTTGP